MKSCSNKNLGVWAREQMKRWLGSRGGVGNQGRPSGDRTWCKYLGFVLVLRGRLILITSGQ